MVFDNSTKLASIEIGKKRSADKSAEELKLEN